jgi:hypothetical protein
MPFPSPFDGEGRMRVNAGIQKRKEELSNVKIRE